MKYRYKKGLTLVARLCVITALLLALAALSGCSDEKARTAYYNYLATIENKGKNRQPQKLLEIEPVPGKPMVFKKITVYQQTGTLKRIVPYIKPTYHPIWGVLGTAVKVAGGVAQIWAAGDAATNLANAVGKHAGHNTTITGTASGTQSGVVVTPGAGSTGGSSPVDSHASTQYGEAEE